ncbi:hypothetical protein [Hoeflea sp.]|uniref:hypothetical protein n=1 Tax=Hoeflea sp. TaxID=1940281 RepID=UPI003B01CE15
MPRFFALLIVLFVALFAQGVAAQETSRTFETPSINGVRVDWCKHFASECGAPAADLFCQQQGYKRATQFAIDPAIGAFGIPTVIFGDGQLCRSPICSGFRAITCSRPEPVKKKKPKGGQIVGKPPKAGPDMEKVVLGPNRTRYRFPKVKNVRLDWCRNWGKNCGAPAADLFCQENGFARAGGFTRDETTGKKGIPSVVFGDGRLCNADYCNGFKQIVCVRGKAPATAEKPTEPPKQEKPAAKPGIELTITVPEIGTVVIPIPTPRPTPPQVAAQPKRPLQTKPPKGSVIVIGPPVSYTRFKPLPQETLTANWVNIIDNLDSYPTGASLFKCSSGDCSIATSADFEIDPDAEYQAARLNYRVDTVPHASGALWQVSYLPYPPFGNGSEADIEPQGLLASDVSDIKEGWFAFDPKELSKDLPGGGGPAIFYVRILPVAAGSGRVVGQPSETMRIYYGADPPQQEPFEFYSKEEVPGSRPQIRMTALEFKPFRQVSRWPPGCKTWEEKYARNDKNFFEKVGKFISGAWSWTSKSYQWVKSRVVEIAATLTFNIIPDSTLEFALNSALVSAGIPPDIPNLNEVMRDGVDGLAKEVAKTTVSQVPTADLATNVGNLAVDITIQTAAGMAEDELRERLEEEIEKRSRQALLQAADELEEQLSSSGKGALCDPTYFHGVYKLTVRNTGDESYEGLQIGANAAPVYLDRTWSVDLKAGEETTLVAVATPRLPNGPYSHPLLPPGKRAEEDMGRWWNDIVYDEEVEIEVTLPGARKCLGGDPSSQFCEQQYFTAHRSPPQLVTEGYRFSQ